MPETGSGELMVAVLQNRELYMHPFLRSVQAGVSSVMCSYSMSLLRWASANRSQH